MALLSYSIASGIPVALTIVKCWNINHQNHRHTYSHEPHDQNDKSNRCYTLYDCDDWYFITWPGPAECLKKLWRQRSIFIDTGDIKVSKVPNVPYFGSQLKILPLKIHYWENRSFHLSFWNFLPKAETESTALCRFFFGLFIYLFFKMDALYR